MGYRLRRMIHAGMVVRLALSVVLSFIIWGFIVWETNPEQTREFSNVAITPLNAPADMLIIGGLPTVTVTIKGPQDIVRTLASADVIASIDLESASGPGIGEYSVEVEAPPGLRRVIVEPEVVEVELDRVVSETFALAIREDEPRPLNLTSLDLSTTLVSVQGSQALVSRVAAVEVPIEFGERSESFVEEVAPIPVNEQGERVDGVGVSPSTVEVSVTFETTSKSVPVHVICACIVDDRLDEIVLDDASAIPSTVPISGPSSALAMVEAIRTVPIDPSILQESGWILGVDLDLSQIPSSITVGDQSIDVWVPVQPSQQQVSDVEIGLLNLDQGLEAELSIDTVTVIVEGTPAAIEPLSESELTAIVDVGGFGPGTYTVEVRVVLPMGITFVEVDPETVEITIQRVPQPNNQQRMDLDPELLESVR